MQQIAETLEFFGAFSVAIEVGFETLFSMPGIDGYFQRRKKDMPYLKRVIILAFCLLLCTALYLGTGPEAGALFLARVFRCRIPVLDVVFTALLMAGGSRTLHDALEGISGRGAAKLAKEPS